MHRIKLTKLKHFSPHLKAFLVHIIREYVDVELDDIEFIKSNRVYSFKIDNELDEWSISFDVYSVSGVPHELIINCFHLCDGKKELEGVERINLVL